MNKLIFTIILSILSFPCFSKTVKELENKSSQNVVALFNKVCMEAYLDEEELFKFLSNNNFEDLNNENISNNKINPEVEKNKKSKEFYGLSLSSTGKHYSIANENKIYFLDIEENTCSVLIKSINQDIFNNQFKDFRKNLTTQLFTETSKSFENRFGSTNYKLTSYFYFDKVDSQQLPFELYLTQTSAKKTNYQLKLTVHLENRKDILENKNKGNDKFLNTLFKKPI